MLSFDVVADITGAVGLFQRIRLISSPSKSIPPVDIRGFEQHFAEVRRDYGSGHGKGHGPAVLTWGRDDGSRRCGPVVSQLWGLDFWMSL